MTSVLRNINDFQKLNHFYIPWAKSYIIMCIAIFTYCSIQLTKIWLSTFFILFYLYFWLINYNSLFFWLLGVFYKLFQNFQQASRSYIVYLHILYHFTNNVKLYDKYFYIPLPIHCTIFVIHFTSIYFICFTTQYCYFYF